jgi:hypothetical protein
VTAKGFTNRARGVVGGSDLPVEILSCGRSAQTNSRMIEIRANWGDQAASVCSKLDLICINLHKIERYVVDSKSSMSSLEG